MHENHKEAVGALADAVTKWQAGAGVLWSELSRALREGGACEGDAQQGGPRSRAAE